MASEFCPRCGIPRVGALRFCRSCGLDYDALPSVLQPPASPTVAQPAAGARAPTPAGTPMKNVGMLPTTRYSLIALYVIVLMAGAMLKVMEPALWFVAWSVIWVIVFFVWNAIRQAQVDIEYQRRIGR